MKYFKLNKVTGKISKTLFPEIQKINETYVNDFRVSTVFLSINHSFEENKIPILFETMAFSPDGRQFQVRCSSLEDAKDLHERCVQILIDHLNLDLLKQLEE